MSAGHHSNLETLWLEGSSTLAFDPTTLDSTPKLTSLRIYTGNGDDPHFFIPPVQELERSYRTQKTQNVYGQDEEDDEEGGERDASFQTGIGITTDIIPRLRWTWNWDLPVLIYAMFTAEFAYRFQFRMLLKCPRLKVLHLDMTSMDGLDTRVSFKADLFVSISSSAPSGSYSGNIQSDERIVAPWIDTLWFRGQWVIEDSLLPKFLAGTFPRPYYFNEKTFGGISLLGLLKVIRVFASDEGCEIEAEEEEEDGQSPLSVLQRVIVDMLFNFADVELLDELGVYPLRYYIG